MFNYNQSFWYLACSIVLTKALPQASVVKTKILSFDTYARSQKLAKPKYTNQICLTIELKF